MIICDCCLMPITSVIFPLTAFRMVEQDQLRMDLPKSIVEFHLCDPCKEFIKSNLARCVRDLMKTRETTIALATLEIPAAK